FKAAEQVTGIEKADANRLNGWWEKATAAA
ncbi:YkgJ family cysteine cluster protein, partial [Pseudomonas syringae pv. tagetis]